MFCSLFCFALELMAPAGATAPAPAPASAAGAVAPNRGALFKVVAGAHTLYLFGTIHVGSPDFYPLEPRVSGALRRASVLALEIDPQGDQSGIVKAVQQYGMYRDGGSALAEIGPEYRPRLERLLKQYAIEPAAVAHMKPWFLASMLAIGEFSEQGYASGLAVDTYLAQQAHQRKIPVLELESVAGQMALFDSMAPADQLRFLEDSIDSIDDKEQAKQAREIAEAWGKADAAALDALAREAAEDQTFAGRFVQRVLLEQRNPGLATGIAGLLARENNSMAAIGVLHLVGKGSVPELLRRRGLKVERVY